MPQSVSPAYRSQMRWGLLFLLLQLALQSYSVYLRSGFGSDLVTNNGWFIVFLAAGWGIFLGGLVHYFWRAALYKWQVAAIYILPAVALSLPIAVGVWSQQRMTAQEQNMSPEVSAFTAMRDFDAASPALRMFPCDRLQSLGFDKQIASPVWNRISESKGRQDWGRQGLCYAITQEGPLVLEQFPGWLKSIDAKKTQLFEKPQMGNLVSLEVQTELPSSRYSQGPDVPVQINIWGIRHVNRSTALTDAERQFMSDGLSSFIIIMPLTQRTTEQE